MKAGGYGMYCVGKDGAERFRLVTPEDGEVEVAEAEADRLSRLGVADIIGDTGDAPDGVADGGDGEEAPLEDAPAIEALGAVEADRPARKRGK